MIWGVDRGCGETDRKYIWRQGWGREPLKKMTNRKSGRGAWTMLLILKLSTCFSNRFRIQLRFFQSMLIWVTWFIKLGCYSVGLSIDQHKEVTKWEDAGCCLKTIIILAAASMIILCVSISRDSIWPPLFLSPSKSSLSHMWHDMRLQSFPKYFFVTFLSTFWLNPQSWLVKHVQSRLYLTMLPGIKCFRDFSLTDTLV